MCSSHRDLVHQTLPTLKVLECVLCLLKVFKAVAPRKCIVSGIYSDFCQFGMNVWSLSLKTMLTSAGLGKLGTHTWVNGKLTVK